MNKNLLISTKNDFDAQLDRFSKIWCKEVLNRKRRTKRGIIAEEVLTNISQEIYSGYPCRKSMRSRFENAIENGDLYLARTILSQLIIMLDGYKETVRKGQLSWFGC